MIDWTPMAEHVPDRIGDYLVTIGDEVERGIWDGPGGWLSHYWAERDELRELQGVTHYAPWPEPAK